MEITPEYAAFKIGVGSTPYTMTAQPMNAMPFAISWTNIQNQNLLTSKLKEIAEECAQEGWDGYNAVPIGNKALLRADQVIKAIPYNFELPELTPQADGEISFAWRHSPYHQMMFTVSESGKMNYAGLLGAERFWGWKQLSEISDLLDELRTKYNLRIAA